MQVNVTEYNIHSVTIRWQMSKSIYITFCIYALSRTISGILIFQIFGFEK